ncbi:MAG: ATP-binding protein [Candidatus Woesearchaeota archaeon]
MDKTKIINVLQNSNLWGNLFELGILRKNHIDLIEKRSQMQEAIVIEGVRRSGKSTITKQFLNHMVNKGIKKHKTLYINFEEPLFAPELNLELIDNIYDTYQEIISSEGADYIVMDEIQNIPLWEKWVRSKLESNNKIKIIVTGSSSKLLASEFSTVLSGRSTKITMFPLSFKEFLKFKGMVLADYKDIKNVMLNQNKIKPLLREYLEFGGFPRVVLEKKENKQILLKEYYEAIILRDITSRYKLKETNILKALTTILLTNNASLVSIGKLANLLKESFKRSVSLETVSNYLCYLELAQLTFLVPIFSYKIKDQLQYPKKVYCIDLGMRNAVSFRFSEDIGKLAENIVFLELKRMEKEIYYWKSRSHKEADFVIKEGLKIKGLINVSWDITDNKTKQREIDSMLEAMEEFGLNKGIIITENYENEEKFNKKKIKYIPLWKWLLVSKKQY